MTTTYYASVTSDASTMQDVSHSGTSSTSTDILEIRMGNGTYLPSRREVFNFLELIERWVLQGGLDQAGANLPLPPNTSNP